MDIRLIVVDLDGTLMQKDETVSPRAQAAFALSLIHIWNKF